MAEVAIEAVGAGEWEEFIAHSPAAVLVLTKSDCAACAAWSEELTSWLGSGSAPDGVRVGKMVLDVPGLGAFKRASPWLRDVDALPYNVVYRGGEKVKAFAGSGVARLEGRLNNVLGESTTR